MVIIKVRRLEMESANRLKCHLLEYPGIYAQIER